MGGGRGAGGRLYGECMGCWEIGWEFGSEPDGGWMNRMRVVNGSFQLEFCFMVRSLVSLNFIRRNYDILYIKE